MLSALDLQSHVLQGREAVFFLITLLFLPSFSRCFRLFGWIQIYFHTRFFQPAFEDSFVLSLTLLLDIFHLFYSYFIILLFVSEDIHWEPLFSVFNFGAVMVVVVVVRLW